MLVNVLPFVTSLSVNRVRNITRRHHWGLINHRHLSRKLRELSEGPFKDSPGIPYCQSREVKWFVFNQLTVFDQCSRRFETLNGTQFFNGSSFRWTCNPSFRFSLPLEYSSCGWLIGMRGQVFHWSTVNRLNVLLLFAFITGDAVLSFREVRKEIFYLRGTVEK